jgi:hypothetical protein
MWLIAAGLLVQVPAVLWGIPGSKATNNAIRILRGDVPYRDFWTMYAPGHFYLGAALYQVFGIHAWVQALASHVFVALDAALLFVITRRLGLERRLAWLVGASLVGMLWGHLELSAYETVLLFLLLALDRVLAYLHGRGARQLVIAGLLLGVAACFKHDVAFHVASGTTAGLVAAWFLLAERRPDHWLSPAGLVLRLAGGAVAAAAPMLIYLAWNAGPDAWRDLIVFPATDFRVVRGEGYPSLFPDWRGVLTFAGNPRDLSLAVHLSRQLPTWVYANVLQGAIVAGVVVLVRTRRILAPIAAATTAICVACMPLFWASAHVQHNTNFWTLWIFAVLLGTLVWTRADPRMRRRAILASLFVAVTGSLLVGPARRVAEIGYRWPDSRTLDFPAVRGVRVARSQYEVHQPIITFIRQHVPESEPIYAGLMRHDSVVINNQSFSFLAGRPPATRYNELHPGVVDREEVQREIIADLDRHQVRCAVLWDFGWPPALMDSILAERRRRIPELGATLLDEYFRREFQPIGRYGEYVLVWRKGGVVPSPPERIVDP